MSDSTNTETTDAPIISWADGLTDRVELARVVHAEHAAADILKRLRNGDREMHQVCITAEKVHRLYLKGDKARLTLYFGQEGPLGTRGVAWQTAYGWIQAGRVLRTFSDQLKPLNEKDPIGVKVLAMYDRFVGTAETEQAGREAITREAVAAVTEGRPAFTNSPKSVASTIVAPVAVAEGEQAPSEAEAAAIRESNRIGRIAGRHQEKVRGAFAEFRNTLEMDGEMAAYIMACKLGATIGSASGGSTPLALDAIANTWQAEVEKAARDKAEAARLLTVQQEAARLLAGTPDAPKPETTIVPAARSTRGLTPRSPRASKPRASKPKASTKK